METSEIIKQLRNERHLSQAELAKRLNISKSSISMYEMGDRYPIREVLEQIADFFNVDMNFLTGKSEVRNSYNIQKTTVLSQDEENLIELYRGLPEESRALVTSFLKMHSELALHSSSKKGKSTHREHSDEPGPIRTTLFYQ